MRRTFDLLSAPVAPGAITTTSTVLPWKGSKFISCRPAEEIAPDFERIDDLSLKDGVLTMSFQNTGKRTCRLAAIVIVDTDEKTAQAPPKHELSWPALVVKE